MARVFVTRHLPGGALKRLAAEHDVDLWREQLPPSPDDLRDHAADKAGLLALLSDRVDAELMDACPRPARGLQLRGRLRQHRPRRRGAAHHRRRRHRRRPHRRDRRPRLRAASSRPCGGCPRPRPPCAPASGRRGGRSGCSATRSTAPRWASSATGRIGRAVAKRASGFDMEVLHTGDGGHSLEEVLGRSDAVSLHVPLTPTTRHLIDEAALAQMKPTADAGQHGARRRRRPGRARRALRDGVIAGAALDVTDPEPLPPDHPLLELPNLLVLPHIGSATHPTRERMADVAVDNLLAGLAGQPLPSPARADPMRVAVVDIGTNSTRLLVADLEDGQVVRQLDKRSEVTRLGEGVDATGRLGDERHAAGLRARSTTTAREVDELGAETATSACSPAPCATPPTAPSSRRPCASASASTPAPSTATTEAELTFAGATSERDPADTTPLVVVDIGGGSTEVVHGRRRRRWTSTSPPRPGSCARPSATSTPTRRARGARAWPPRCAASSLDNVPDDVRDARQRRHRGRGHGDVVRRDRPGARSLRPRQGPRLRARAHPARRHLLERLAAMPLEQRRQVTGLHPDRAPTIVAGVVILSRCSTPSRWTASRSPSTTSCAGRRAHGFSSTPEISLETWPGRMFDC